MSESKNINAANIHDPQNPMRSDIDRERVWELSESIKKQGLINPITVRPAGENYEVVAGHRRFIACKLAGLIDIPCVVRDLTDGEAQEIMAAENLEREEVDPVDEALMLGRLVGENEEKIDEVAKRLNRSAQWVTDRLDILTYPEYMVLAIKEGKIKLGVAKWLGRITDEVYREMFVNSAIRDGMPVWQAEYYHTQWKSGIFKEGADILPPAPGDNPSVAAKARANCAKCGRLAEDPNLRNVFIHAECPADPAPAPVEA